MEASELLRRYAAGERDFRRTNLRGQNFVGQDLSGADFSEADIRGTNFSKATLKGANFTGAIAGVQKRWIIGQLLLALALSTLIGFLQGYLGYWIAYYFPRWWDSIYDWNYFVEDLAVTIAYCIIIPATFVAIAYQGFTTKAAATIGLVGVVAVAVAGVIAFAGAGVVAFAGAGSVAIAFVFAVAGAVAGAGVVAFAGTIAGTIAFVGTFTGAVAVAVAIAGAGIVAVAGVVTVASLLLGIYCSRYALEGDEKFALLRTLGVAFGALGGTHFHDADLTLANFTRAILKGTNFREAVLTQVCWQDAQKLDRARLGESILADAAVRDLLVTRNGYKKSYVDAKLRGANLNGVNLEQATLTWADLSGATLHHSNLKDANLREVLAIGTDFTGAYLTGACLESWNIDHTTQLKDVDCQYIFLLEYPNELGSRERRPHDPEEVFQPGDFAKLYHKMINVVQVLFRNGMNRVAFAEAFQTLMAEHPDISYDAVQAIERKGNDALVTLEVAETADKATISRTLQAAYEEKILQLEAKVERLHELRAADLKDVAMTQKAQIFNQLVGGGNAMQSNQDSSQNISVGGDFNINATNSVVNLRDISGSVTNTINQLPDSTNPAQPSLKELLTQLQRAIESEVELPDPDKADLLEQVKVFAEVPQTEEPAQKEGMARRAKKLFEATLKSLPDTAKIVEACAKLLPMILTALGL